MILLVALSAERARCINDVVSFLNEAEVTNVLHGVSNLDGQTAR